MSRARPLTEEERKRSYGGGIAKWGNLVDGELPEERGEELYKRLIAGESVRALSRDLDVSYQRIYQLIDRYKIATGVPRRRYRRYGYEVRVRRCVVERTEATLRRLPVDVVKALGGRKWSLAHPPVTGPCTRMPCRRHLIIEGRYYCVHLRRTPPTGGPLVYPKDDLYHRYWHLTVDRCLKEPRTNFIVMHVPRVEGPATFVIPRAAAAMRKTISIIGIDFVNKWGKRNPWEQFRDAWPWTEKAKRGWSFE